MFHKDSISMGNKGISQVSLNHTSTFSNYFRLKSSSIIVDNNQLYNNFLTIINDI